MSAPMYRSVLVSSLFGTDDARVEMNGPPTTIGTRGLLRRHCFTSSTIGPGETYKVVVMATARTEPVRRRNANSPPQRWGRLMYSAEKPRRRRYVVRYVTTGHRKSAL